jgi:F0F1-type ATP synthase epsilon subunit
VKLVIVSPQHKYEYDVEWIEAFTPSGSLVIKSGHAPIILTLVAGFDFSFLLPITGEKKIIKLIRPGFLEVNRTSVLALISQENELI